MKHIFKILYNCHKWFGIPLALMFIMWYCSGIVMMYHGFPRLSGQDRPVERVDRTELDSLWRMAPDSVGMSRLAFSGKRLQLMAGGETFGGYRPDRHALEEIAASFNTVIQRVDTLDDIDKWTPFNHLVRHLPFYRIVGDDDSYIYVSSVTGEIVQHATLSARRWAWVGALPHYFYVTPIRRDSALWRKVVIWMSGLSTLSVLFGMVIAVRFLLRRRKLRLFIKRSWQWHYSWGLFFGIFMFAFIFSGMMSLADIPDWIMKSRRLEGRGATAVAKEDVDLTSLPERFGQATLNVEPQLLWTVDTGGEKIVTGAECGRAPDFTPSFMTGIIERQTGEKVTDVSRTDGDIYYNVDDVPGYKARTEHFTVYWNDRGYYRVLDAKGKARNICYRFLHTMRIPGLVRVKWLHELYMWVILLGGIVIVATGTVLSVRSFKR